MKTVEMYESEDGKLFDTEEKCILYERSLQIKSILTNKSICGNLTIEQVIEVLTNNKETFKMFLNYL